MMFRNACRQMTRSAAILAVALLCAQTLVAVHDHEPADDAFCAVCTTTSDAAAATTSAEPSARVHAAPRSSRHPVDAALPGLPASHPARAPPAA